MGDWDYGYLLMQFTCTSGPAWAQLQSSIFILEWLLLSTSDFGSSNKI